EPSMSIVHHIYEVVGGYFRRKRLRWLTTEFRDCHQVIDLGGRVDMWKQTNFAEHTTVVNIEPAPDSLPSTFTYILGDARATGFQNQAFDLAFSNSVIEHVGSFDDQKRFAHEMLRLGKRVYCQTPNKWFPVEPHFLGLCVHWLPGKWFSHFVDRYLTLHGWRYRPSREESVALINSIRLLTRAQLLQLFPGCKINSERFLGLPKSFVVWK
ncbi:MAG: class I SAM-dependent methyltransferase, partial [Acidobacteriaceae bacterium]|nr:class I SAM-dependent methyltransferase [Acidobacteriaceae bacterium]